MMDVPRPPAGVVERFKTLGDCTGVISDTMDELGVPLGVVGASVLKPTMPGTIMVGPALTLRNILQRIDPLAGARDHVNKMAEFECHNLASPGDVLVIQGVPNISNMGGNSAQTGKRQGEAGAIVQGGVRDVVHQRSRGLSDLGERHHAGHRQMADRGGRDQRAGRDRRRAGASRRPRGRRRHRRLLHPARLHHGSPGSRREKGEVGRHPRSRRSTPALRCRTSCARGNSGACSRTRTNRSTVRRHR